MAKWWKQPRFIGNAAYVGLKILANTLRVKVEKNAAIDPTGTYLFVFWHGKQLIPSFLMCEQHRTPLCAMVSPSRDGAILAHYLQNCGFEVVRGSSRDSGVAGLIKVKQKLKQGISTGFGVDGPIGPIYVPKPGVAFLAQKCGVAIVPVGSASNRTWIFQKAWDKFQLPKPFAKVGLVLGQPFVVPQDMSLECACAEVQRQLHASEARALDLIS